MQIVKLTYKRPPAAQPEIVFAFGNRTVKLADGAEIQAAADPAHLPPVPPGVSVEIPGAPQPRASRVLAAKRGEKWSPPRRTRATVETDVRPGGKSKAEEK